MRACASLPPALCRFSRSPLSPPACQPAILQCSSLFTRQPIQLSAVWVPLWQEVLFVSGPSDFPSQRDCGPICGNHPRPFASPADFGRDGEDLRLWSQPGQDELVRDPYPARYGCVAEHTISVYWLIARHTPSSLWVRCTAHNQCLLADCTSHVARYGCAAQHTISVYWLIASHTPSAL